MIREVRPTATLRACDTCKRHPLVLHDARKGGSYSVDCPRCRVRTLDRPTQTAAEREWGYESRDVAKFKPLAKAG